MLVAFSLSPASRHPSSSFLFHLRSKATGSFWRLRSRSWRRAADACQESTKVASSSRRRRFLPPEMPSTTVRRSLQGHQKRAKKVKAIRAVFWQAFVGSSGDYFLSQNDCSCCEVLEAAAENERSLNNSLRLCRWLDRDTFATGIIYATVATKKS